MSFDPSLGHGMTPLERRVMGLWDNGASVDRIAERTGLPVERAQKIVSRLSLSPSDHFEAAARASSAALLAAIARAHPEIVRG